VDDAGPRRKGNGVVTAFTHIAEMNREQAADIAVWQKE
jgi:hypothetical protein